MKFVLLGNDPESLSLAAAAEQLGHEVTRCEDPQDSEGTGSAADLWSFLPEGESDAAIVGPHVTNSAWRAQQLQEIAKTGLPILAVHPVVPEVLAFFEIDMARGESGGLLRHYNPLTQCPTLPALAEWIRDGHPQLGKIEQVVAERTFDKRTREKVLWHFARDVELLIQIAGPLDRIGALGSGNDDAAYAGLSVQLLGKQAVPVRWSVGPVNDSSGLEVVLVGERGRLVARFDEQDMILELSDPGNDSSAGEELESYDPAKKAMVDFIEAAQESHGKSTWSAALQAMELVDSIEISLRRGRMIEVHHQQLTEHLAFKGTMAALGCGVLLVLPPLLVLMGWIAGLMGLPIPRYWYAYLLLALLAVFLGLQVLPKFVYSEKKD